MAYEQRDNTREPFPWQLGIFDAHCHPTDTMSSIELIPRMKARVLTVMATRRQDQELVAGVADTYGLRLTDVKNLWGENEVRGRMVPCFGWHPWFSHQIYDDRERELGQANATPDKAAHYETVLSPTPEDHEFTSGLPQPLLLSAYLAYLKEYLHKHPFALVGEVGLDRTFRIPNDWLLGQEEGRDPSLTPGGREGRRLSPYRVRLEHQRSILKAQLDLAGEMHRAVSLHGVQTHGALFATVQATWRGFENKTVSKRSKKKHSNSAEHEQSGKADRTDAIPPPYPPRICLHSYSGPPDTLRQYLNPAVPTEVYFSFSMVINFSTSRYDKAVQVIKAVPDDRILVESDLHCAGERMDDLLEEVTRSICEIKGWSLDEGVKQLAINWRQFVFGDQHKDRPSD